MASEKGETRQTFNTAVKNAAPKKVTSNTVPRMIRDDQPVPRPAPPSIGFAVDAQSFNQRWQQESKSAKPLDPFDAIDAQKKSLTQAFKHSATPIKGRGQELD